MALLEINWRPTRRELRQFALLMFGFGILLLAWGWWQAGPSSTRAIAGLGMTAAGAAGAFAPQLLRPVYVAWMAVAFPIGWVVSHLVLAGVFYLVLTPIGIIMKLVGRDPLQRRFDREADTYWSPRGPQPQSRRYFRQF